VHRSAERFIRFQAPGVEAINWGLLEGEQVAGWSRAPWLPGASRTDQTFRYSSLQILAPAEPTKILALGYNYKDLFLDAAARSRSDEPHYEDQGFEPMIFLKGLNSLVGNGVPVAFPRNVSEVWVEVEIAAVIGKRARRLRHEAEARDAIFGVTIGNDISALNIMGRDWHLARSKSLDGFCPLGPILVKGVDEGELNLQTWINDRKTQDSKNSNRVLDTLRSVMFASNIMTLEPGDVILTGTPRGARQSLVKPGDRVRLDVEGIGSLETPIIPDVSPDILKERA